MQKNYYDAAASQWSVDNRNPVVGTFDAHNAWDDYKYLFLDITDTTSLKALDFGCGPGRNIVKYSSLFKQIDGVDLSEVNLHNAKRWCQHNNVRNNSHLYHCNGIDLNGISSSSYDVVFSTICLQHICVHEIRYNYFKEFFRILNPGGTVTMQMGYGVPSPLTVGYYENFYDANTTNRGCDVAIESEQQIKKDLEEIGFRDFKFYIRPPGPGDCHPNWIFFNAKSPSK